MKLFIFLLIFSFSVYGATFKKITELATYPITSVATDDIFVIVDTSSGPTTVSISFDELDKRFYNANYTDTATFSGEVVLNGEVTVGGTINVTGDATLNKTTIADGNVFTVEATAYLKSYLVLVSPDDSCSACSVDDADSFTCTATTCP